MTKEKWIEQNKPGFTGYASGYDWYYQTYPFLKSEGFLLPISFQYLKIYYEKDMALRNLNVVPGMLREESYDLLFGYFLENYPKDLSDKAKVKPFISYVIQNIPEGFQKSIRDISTTIGSGLTTLLILGFITLIILIMVKK